MKLINKKTLIALVVAAGVIFVFFRLKNKDANKYYIVYRQDMDLITETSGYVESKNEAELYFEVAEKVTDVLVVEGDVVKKGDLLATVSAEYLAQSSNIAKDSRDIAQLEKDLFVENYATKMNAVGGADEYKLQLEGLDKNVSRASTQYNQSLLNMRKSAIVAPFDGTVSKIYVGKGDLSSINRPAIELQDVASLVLYTNIAEVDIAHIDENDKVEITFDAFPDKIFTGQIDRINPVANTIQGVSYYKAEIKTEDLPEKLRVGMAADVNILVEKRQNVLYLPIYVINNVSATSGVVRLSTQKGVVDTEIKIGLNNYAGVEVLSGLKEGGTVVY